MEVWVDSGLLLGQGHWLQQSSELQSAGISPFDGGHREDPLEKELTTHSSILAWRIPWATVHGVTESWTRLSNFMIPSAQRFVWAAKQALGKAALGALFA